MMRPGAVGIVLRKELTDAVRDRRSLFVSLAMSILAGPLMIALIVNMIAGQRDKARDLTLPVIGAERAPALIAFLERDQVKISAAPGDFAAQIRAGDLDVVLEIDERFAADASSGEPARVVLHFDRSRDRAAATIARAERLLDAYGRIWGDARLVLRGVVPDAARPLRVDRFDYATAQQSGALILFMVAYYGLFAAIIGGLAAALDTTAGERERGSLEPLLTNPVGVAEIAIGKWLAVVALNALVVVLTLAGFWLTLRFAPLPAVGVPFLFGERELARFAIVLWPVVLLVPAVQLALGTRGRTFKEAQTNVQLLLFVVSMLPLVQFFLQRKEPAWLLAVPVNGQYALLSRVLRGDALPTGDLLLSYAVPLAATALALALFARLLSREAIAGAR